MHLADNAAELEEETTNYIYNLFWIRATDLKLRVCLPVADPVLSLCLWIYQQWIASCLGHDDAILRGQLIIGQTLEIPFCNLGGGRSVNWFRQYQGIQVKSATCKNQ